MPGPDPASRGRFPTDPDEGCMKHRSSNVIVAALIGWLVPGGGHLYLGMRAKGWLLFGVILGTFATGLVLADFHAVRLERHPIYFAAYVFLGLPTLVTMLATESLQVTHYIVHESLGTLYCATAALLNLLVILDLWAASARRVEGADS
jgi:hypothetical protein